LKIKKNINNSIKANIKKYKSFFSKSFFKFANYIKIDINVIEITCPPPRKSEQAIIKILTPKGMIKRSSK